MTVNRPLFAALLAVLAAGLFPAPARADKLDREAKRWLDEVSAVMLPEEGKTFKRLKAKADVAEFQKIFWARRDPKGEPPSPENEFRAAFEKAKAEADSRFRVGPRAGSETDCGKVYILMGEPNQVKKDEGGGGLRTPETWTYRDRPGMTFTGGELQLPFDGACQVPQASARFEEFLARVAGTKIVRPNIDYRFGKDGGLTKLVDLLPKPTPIQALLKEPRQDFAVATQAAFLKVQDGGTALLGLVRGDAAGMAAEGAGTIRVVIGAQALTEDGKVAAVTEQEALGEVAEGSFVGSYRLGLQPGKYTLRAAALDPKTKKGSVATMPVEVPDFRKGELTIASLMILRGVEDVANADPRQPYSAFVLGGNGLVPRFGTAVAKNEEASFFYQFYDAAVDDSGKASAVASFSISREGKTVAKAEDMKFDTVIGGNIVGPVPLKYDPGSYLARLRIKDNVAKRDYVKELAFEIR